MMNKLEIYPDASGYVAHADQDRKLINAIDLASDQDQSTWLTENGKNIAAIVTVELVEFAQQHGYFDLNLRP